MSCLAYRAGWSVGTSARLVTAAAVVLFLSFSWVSEEADDAVAPVFAAVLAALAGQRRRQRRRGPP